MSGSRVSPEAVVDLLNCTQEVLNRDGWIQGKLHSPEGHCLVGGLHTAAKENHVWYQTTGVALMALGNTLIHIRGPHSGVGQWNDLKSTSRADVDELLAETIERTIANG